MEPSIGGGHVKSTPQGNHERLMTAISTLKPCAIVGLLFTCSLIVAQDKESTRPRSPAVSADSVLGADNAKLVDLTHPFDEQTIYWPTESGFRLQMGPAGVTPKGYYYTANRFTAAEHGGTHIDAPNHFYQGRRSVDQIPLEQLIGKAVVVDVSDKCAGDSDYQVGIKDLRQWEENQRRQLVDVIVLLRTGYGRRWPNRKEYLGTDEAGPEAVAKLHFPGLSPEAAKWLVENRSVKAIGIDTASIDFGQSTKFGSHVKLFEHNVPVFENVANLEKLPDKDFTIIALPMKIGGGSGAPLRIVAVLPN